MIITSLFRVWLHGKTPNPKLIPLFLFFFHSAAFAHAKRRGAHNNYHEFCLHTLSNERCPNDYKVYSLHTSSLPKKVVTFSLSTCLFKSSSNFFSSRSSLLLLSFHSWCY
jgi:hypothetical protein